MICEMTVATHDHDICICIAAYNAESTIARAVTSALQQPEASEVIVVDDASADATAAIARQCDDGSGRLSIILQEKNGGPSTARNSALSKSRASIFCVLDSDDYLLPGRISRLLAASDDDWDFLADDILIVPEGAAFEHDTRLPNHSPAPLVELDAATFVLANVSAQGRPRAELGFLKPLIRRRFLEAHGLTYDAVMRLGEDYALYVRALMAGARFKVTGFCGYVALERAASLSSTHRASDLAAISAFDAECLGTPGLSERTRRALAVHWRATRNKWALARALEIRREQGVGPALRFLTAQPGSAGYVASKILHARLKRLRPHPPGEETAPKPRWLIGQRAIQPR
jgi:succinoglycan biosynthesis protein ExoU